MGEVYRADDLRLGESVALKFLPESLAHNERALTRLRNEVRIARQVTHPAVCRVYDIVEVDGESFITMEYVDGEDLSSLLRRIGRIPPDKATEIARQICAGLAAAHANGVLHRDLKPANIMLDGRGRARITDFGIAIPLQSMDGVNIAAGTPAYMAPEQREGREVTERSDIYALGLVLYEIFSGREASEFASETSVTSPGASPTRGSSSLTNLFPDIDPAVERVISRCLAEDPGQRPPSAIAVAAALPGGDPLAEALAAGETPSPEMVAHAGEAGMLRPRTAVALFVTILASIALGVFCRDLSNLLSYVSLETPPAVHVERARDLLEELGWPRRPMDEAWWLGTNGSYLRHIQASDTGPDRWRERFAKAPPSPMLFVYRADDNAYLIPWGSEGQVRWNDPPLVSSGMARILLDTDGRLVRLDVVPHIRQESVEDPTEPDWAWLFEKAGLELQAFEPIEPQWRPDVQVEEQRAWSGKYASHPDIAIRVEAGAYRGQIVHFEIYGPWSEGTSFAPTLTAPGLTRDRLGDLVREGFAMAMLLAVLLSAGWLAIQNVRARRGDGIGAMRLAAFIFVTWMVSWLLTASHVPDLREWSLLVRAFATALSSASLGWVFYLGIEPYARRHWPQSLIAWTRLLSGRVRDPMVGRDILAGCVAGLLVNVGDDILNALAASVFKGQSYLLNVQGNIYSLKGGSWSLAGLFQGKQDFLASIGVFVMFLLLRGILKRGWLAALVLFLGAMVLLTDAFTAPIGRAAYGVVVLGIAFTMIFKFGLLSLVVMSVTVSWLGWYPTTFQFDQFYALGSWTGPLATIVLSGFAAWTAIGGQPIVPRDLLAP